MIISTKTTTLIQNGNNYFVQKSVNEAIEVKTALRMKTNQHSMTGRNGISRQQRIQISIRPKRRELPAEPISRDMFQFLWERARELDRIFNEEVHGNNHIIVRLK